MQPGRHTCKPHQPVGHCAAHATHPPPTIRRRKPTRHGRVTESGSGAACGHAVPINGDARSHKPADAPHRAPQTGHYWQRTTWHTVAATARNGARRTTKTATHPPPQGRNDRHRARRTQRHAGIAYQTPDRHRPQKHTPPTTTRTATDENDATRLKNDHRSQIRTVHVKRVENGQYAAGNGQRQKRPLATTTQQPVAVRGQQHTMQTANMRRSATNSGKKDQNDRPAASRLSTANGSIKTASQSIIDVKWQQTEHKDSQPVDY